MKVFDNEPVFNKTVLDNGVRVLSEHHKYSRSTSVGIYVDLGTRDEPSHLNGAAHFIEHLLFKGTPTRSAYQIVKELEEIGGEINAYTTKELTCFHAATLREHSEISLNVLSDLIANAELKPEDFIKEHQVILQEIDMSADLLEESIFDKYFEYIYQGQALSLPILGTPESLSKIQRDELFDFYKSRYHGSDLIVSVSGDVDHNKIVGQVSQLLNFKGPKAEIAPRIKPEFTPFKKVIARPSEQVHLLIGVPSSTFSDRFRFEAFIVNAVLGSSMTSHLYQKVREEKGLVYSIYSYLQTFVDSGTMLTYVGTSEDNLTEVIDDVHLEFTSLAKNGITQKELDLYKTQIIGNIILGADDVENRMNSIAINEMIFSDYRSVDSVIAEIKAVSEESIREYLGLYFDTSKAGYLLMGDLKKTGYL